MVSGQRLYNKLGFGLERLHLKPYHRDMISFCEQYFKGKSLVGVEIGVCRGENALQIFRLLNINMLYLVDAYLPYVDGDGKVRDSEYLQQGLNTLNNRLDRFMDQYVLLKMYSSDAVKHVPDDLDFCYIDGDHNYSGVLDDITHYYPKVRVGGVIGGHDWFHVDVSCAVIDFCKKHDLLSRLHTGFQDWWLVK